MCAAPIDFAAERRFVEASDDPHEILNWVGEYRQHAREAAVERDNALARRFAELIDFATDRVVELKAARLRPPTRLRAAVEDEVCTPRLERMVSHGTITETAPAARSAKVPTGVPAQVPRNDSALGRAEELAAAKAAAERAEAAQERADREELRQLHVRAAHAKARRDAALAATARIEADAKRAAVEAASARREDAKRKAAQEAEDAERAAADAEAAERTALAFAATATGHAAVSTDLAHPLACRKADRQNAEPSAESTPELTPLAMLFQEQLADVAAQVSTQLPSATGAPSSPSRPSARAGAGSRASACNTEFRAASPAASRTATGSPATPKLTSPAVSPTPTVLIDDSPPLTGADLTSFRNWLAVSQRALAARLDVEQSSISKGEGKPTTILPPALRKALHQAMGEPRPDAGGVP